MKFRFYLFLLLGMLISLSLSAQQIILQGKVSDASSGKGLPGVVVTIRPVGDNKILKFTKTQGDGGFQLKLTAMPEGKNVLHFSMMGYATQTMPLEEGKTEYDVLLMEQATKLKEVTVKAPSIRQRGDTIAYNVASFADANDKSLADVLKKMPGMEVSDNGEIKYNGKAINKFYIEGHDMLGGRYSIATNNIHQKDVGTVEVMTNHQPIKALEDMSFSEDPAINIKLKESAKSRLVGTLKVGGGFENRGGNGGDESAASRSNKPNVWNGEMSLMRFAKKAQSLNTFKSNNIGTNISREGEILFSDGGEGLMGKNYSLKDYVSVTPDRLTELSDSRVRRNQTHTFTTNNLWALGKNTDLSSQVVYSHDRLVSSAQSETLYFLNDSTVINRENEQAKQKQNKLAADFTLTSNGEKSYLTNRLSTNLAWNDVAMDISGTYPNHQFAKMPRYKVSDKFEVLRRSGKRAYTFSTYNAYLVNPQSLSIERGEKSALSDAATTTNSSAYQSVRSAAFFSHTYTSLGFYLKPFTVSMKVGVQVLSRTMKSHLDGVSFAENQETFVDGGSEDVALENHRNDLSMTYVRMYASPEAEFNQNGWHIRFYMPIAYTPYYYKEHCMTASKNACDESSWNACKAQVAPQLSVGYYLTSHLQATLSGGISQREVDEQNFYLGWILRDYRNLYRGMVDYTMDKTKNVAFNLNYKLPLAAFFANAYVHKTWTDNHLTTARDFVGDYILNSFVGNKSKTENLMAGGKISKGLGFMHGLISVGFEYMAFEGTLLQNDSPSKYSSGNYMLTAKWNGRPMDWLNFTYELNWSKDDMRLKDIDFTSSSTNLAQHLTCNFHFFKSWFIKLQGDHYRNQVSEDQHKSLFLADASTSYALKSGIEFSLSAFNLFNQRTYGYTTYSSLTRMSKEYQLRGRTIIGSIFFHF